MPSLISIKDLEPKTLSFLIGKGLIFKSRTSKTDPFLKNKLIGLLFSVVSTRTRLSFSKAISLAGGNYEFIRLDQLQHVRGESLRDTAEILGQYLDALIIRNYDMTNYGYGREVLNTFKEFSNIPIINALDEIDHPSQVLADLITLKSKWKDDFYKKRILISWGYSRHKKSLGVPHSFLSSAIKLGLKIRFAFPKGYELDEDYIGTANTLGNNIEFSQDLDDACNNVDCIYVKNWKSLKMNSEEEDSYKESLKDNWKITQKHFSISNPHAFYMDCLPSIEEEESTVEVKYGKQSIIFEQARNRIYANQAILEWVFS